MYLIIYSSFLASERVWQFSKQIWKKEFRNQISVLILFIIHIFFKGLLFLELFQFPTCMTLLDFNTCYYKYLEYLEQIKEITLKKHIMLNTIIHKLSYYLSM